MIRLWLGAALAAASAFADSPADYRSSAPVTPSGSDALHRVTLPFEAYRDTRRDLADIRIFNAAGEALPIAFGAEPEPAREAPPAVTLAIFPISATPAARASGGSDLDVVVRSNRDGTIVSVHGRTPGAPRERRPAAWLLDASQLKAPMRSLTIDWETGPGTEDARVTVEASDDLKYWRTVASRAPLLRLEHGGQQLAQRKVDIANVRAKYLRITGEPAAFVLRSVAVEPEQVVTPAPRLKRVVSAAAGTRPGEYVFDLGARLPVESVRVVLGAPNSVAPFTIATREGESGEWRRVTAATFYRLMRDGAEVQSPSVEVGVRPARYWAIQLDPRSPALGSAAPSLEVEWRPAQLVFVARGEGPFTLAFGNPDARRSLLAVSELIPGYERRAEAKLPEARLGEVRSVARSGDAMRQVLGDTSPRKAVLWAILVLGVVALGWMAWRLRRQMGG
jgi:hypothetical protein